MILKGGLEPELIACFSSQQIGDAQVYVLNVLYRIDASVCVLLAVDTVHSSHDQPDPHFSPRRGLRISQHCDNEEHNGNNEIHDGAGSA